MTFAMLLDIVMVCLLSGTIYFAWRLSEGLARFRNNRADMDRLVRELNMAVERAQGAIISLRETADSSGQDLHRVMRQATELSDELQLMTESANALAGRLEHFATKVNAGPAPEPAPARASVTPIRSEPGPSPMFAIRDPEFDGSVTPDHASWELDDLASEAERDLARALSGRSKPARSMM
jgi:hypothetical protein